MIEEIKGQIEKLRSKGFFSIIIGTTLVKIMTFASTIFLPKIIRSKYEYGVLTDIDNIRSYFMLINALGISNAIMRFCVADTEDNKNGNFLFIIFYGIVTDIILSIIYIFVCQYGTFNYEREKDYLLFMSAWLIMSFLLEAMQLFLRAKYQNVQYAIMTFVYATLMFLTQIGLGIKYQTWGVLIGRYISIIVSVFLGFMMILRWKGKNLTKNEIPDNSTKVHIITFGLICMLCNASSLIMQSNEKKILSDKLKDANVLANYQVASTVISIMFFVLNAIIIFITPYFVSHKGDREWCYLLYKKIMKINAYIMIPVHILLFVFSKLFLIMIFGEKYADAVPIMRIMIIASLGLVVFRALPGNIIPLLGFEKYNLIVNIILVVVHYVLANIFVTIYGVNGAAISLTLVYFISGFLYMIKLDKELKSKK